MLRFEAIVHNTRALGCGRVLEKFPGIVTRLAGMVDRFTTMLDCVDVSFLPDGILDQLPLPSQIGPTRIPGIDLNTPRMRAALAALLALAIAPGGFTVAELAAKVRALTGQDDDCYTVRQAAYDLRKLRGKHLVVNPAEPGATSSPPRPLAPSPPSPLSATTSSAPSSPASEPLDADANRATGPRSTATTKPSAWACKPSSTTSPSPSPSPHRQQFVDRVLASP